MTPRQIAQVIFTTQEYDNAILLIKQAIADEREACANIAQSFEREADDQTCRLIEDKIRARNCVGNDPLRAPMSKA